MRIPRPPPPATALTMTGKPTFCAHSRASSSVVDDTVGAGKDGHSVSLDGPTRPVLLAHRADDLRWRADELEPGGFADMREICVFAQQSVAGMNGIDIGNFSGTDDSRNIEVAFSSARRSDTKRFIGKADMK